ncbi:MAG: sugar kinase, partial [Lactobacillaceae bacterium]|nr:sugar kinase [Lactobacillaceae bacterium]
NNFNKFLGGAELNVAIGLQKLGHTTKYISSVGDDPFGEFIKKEMIQNQIQINNVQTKTGLYTGFIMKQKVSKGDPKVFHFRKNSAASHIGIEDILDLDISNIKLAHFTGIFPALSKTTNEALFELIKRLIQNNVFISFDTNLRLPLWENQKTMIETINKYASLSNLVLPGINEGKILTGSLVPEEIADFYLSNPKTEVVIVKTGAKGAFVKTKNGDSYTVNGFQVSKVVDTVGAGDGFALGVISAYLEGLNWKQAALRGNAIGSLQVQTKGDNDGYPTYDQLSKYYLDNGVTE